MVVTKLKKSVRQLVEEAEAEISTLSTDEVQILLDSEEGTLFDIRDVRELWREGTIPGAVHTPRGMLEFWADPESPYHREIFASGKQLVFYCASAWRSALATKALQDMGVPNVAHMAGGFSKWKELNLPINPVEKKI